MSKETCNRISIALSGRPRCEEQKQRISETLKRKYEEIDLKGRFGREPKKILCVETGIIYTSIAEAAREMNIKYKQGISLVANGKRKTCGGYHWQYYEPSVS